MSTAQYSLLCCFFFLFLVPAHITAEPVSSFQAPEPSRQQSKQPDPATTETMQDIIDIYGPVHLPEPPPYLLYASLAVIGAGLVVLLHLLRWALKRKKAPLADPVDVALAELDKAEALKPEAGAAYYCNQVSTILRTYVEQCSGHKITRRTTTESLNELLTQQQNRINRDNIKTLQSCFGLCDKVKFARFSPDSKDTELLGQLALSFVSSTRTNTVEGGSA